MIKPYLSDIINDPKTHDLVKYHSSDKSWLEKTSNEWKIQLTMAINFFLLKILMRPKICIQKVIM